MCGFSGSRIVALLPTWLLIQLGLALPVRPAEAQVVARKFQDCSVCPEMVVVPAGSFMMGSPPSWKGRYVVNENPRHRVTIESPFAVGLYEVTFAEWDACVTAGGCGGYSPDDMGWGRGRLPVMKVSWEDAQRYAKWLSEETGETYRLLSEAEWEYVARAGTQTDRYWGDEDSDQCFHANGNDRSFDCWDGYYNTAPVGSFRANGFGLHDMLGNVWEWTEDCWNDDYSGAPVDGSAWRAGNCSTRVLRGGNWITWPTNLRAGFRLRNLAGFRFFYFGFRVARTLN